MRASAPFTADCLAELDERLLSRADEVVAMREIAAGEHDPLVIGLRHDVDNTLEPCVRLSAWEAERGYRATYYVLHDAPYWESEQLRPTLEAIAELGHEIGVHTNALAVALQTGGDPDSILFDAVERLRSWGHPVTGVVAHGDPLCHAVGFVNDEQFVECARPSYGDPDRTLTHAGVRLPLRPRPLADFGFEYESYRAGARELYLSDSGGVWNEPFEQVADAFPSPFGQLHMLIHNCWWVDAFAKVAA